MSKCILILGAKGLVGSSFNYGIPLTRNEINLLDYKQVLDVFNYYKPDVVVNCAGQVGGVKANMENKFSFFKNNMIINMNVIEASMKAEVPNLISFLSTCIFPDNLASITDRKLSEYDLHYGEPHFSNYPYAYAKRMTQVLSRVARENGFNYQNIIPCNIYGLNDNYNLDSSHIIPALIRKFYHASNDSNFKLEIWGDGTPLREFIFANDIADIIKIIIDNDVVFDDMILSPSLQHSISEVASIIQKITNYKNSLIYDFTKPKGQNKKNTDNSKFVDFCKKYNYELTPLETGLKKTVEYFFDNYKNNPNKLKL